MNKTKLGVTLGLSFTLVLSACGDASTDPQNNADVDNQSNQEDQDNQGNQNNQSNEESKKLTKEKAKSILSEFEDRMLPKTNDENMVEEYDTKQELVDYISKIASEDLVKTWVDNIYEEREEGLYLKTNDEYKHFLTTQNKIEFKQMEEGIYKLIQKNNTEIHGESTLTATLELKNGLYRVMSYDVNTSNS